MTQNIAPVVWIINYLYYLATGNKKSISITNKISTTISMFYFFSQYRTVLFITLYNKQTRDSIEIRLKLIKLLSIANIHYII